MDLTPYVETLRHELAVAAEAAGEDARALAERLTAPLESAVRLTLLDALSTAVEEITRELAPGSVDLRLRGREPSFVVTPPPSDHSFEARDTSMVGTPPPVSSDGEEGAMARINFRLAEHQKGRVEEAAGQAGLSVNAWLVRAAAAGLEADERSRLSDWRAPQTRQRYTGWVR